MRGIHLGRVVSGGSGPGPGPGLMVTFVVIDDVVYITDRGVVYESPVTFVGASSEASGTILAIDDTLRFHFLGGEWSAASTIEPPPDSENTSYVTSDTFYITLGGNRHSMPVTLSVPAGATDSNIVTGSDGAEYERTTYPDGSVRYKPLYETLP